LPDQYNSQNLELADQYIYQKNKTTKFTQIFKPWILLRYLLNPTLRFFW